MRVVRLGNVLIRRWILRVIWAVAGGCEWVVRLALAWRRIPR